MKKIKLKSTGMGRYDDVSPFIVALEGLELSIERPALSGDFYLVAELNGRFYEAQKIPARGTVTLTDLEAGELHIEVKHYLRGDLIDVYPVEPLLLKRVDFAFSAMPEIALLKGENEKLRNDMNELAEWQESVFSELREAIEKQKISFLSYAYAEYQNDVQLNGKGLSAEAFMEALGYSSEEFSEEELNQIKNQGEKL